MEIILKKHPENSLEAWLNRPVYLAQCRTWAMAINLNVVCHGFRSLPAYRDDLVLRARKIVAREIRRQRELASRKSVLLRLLKVVSQHNPVTGFLSDVHETIKLTAQLHQLQRQQDANLPMNFFSFW